MAWKLADMQKRKLPQLKQVCGCCRGAGGQCHACSGRHQLRSAGDGSARSALAEVAGLCRGIAALQQPGHAQAERPGPCLAGSVAWDQRGAAVPGSPHTFSLSRLVSTSLTKCCPGFSLASVQPRDNSLLNAVDATLVASAERTVPDAESVYLMQAGGCCIWCWLWAAAQQRGAESGICWLGIAGGDAVWCSLCVYWRHPCADGISFLGKFGCWLSVATEPGTVAEVVCQLS